MQGESTRNLLYGCVPRRDSRFRARREGKDTAAAERGQRIDAAQGSPVETPRVDFYRLAMYCARFSMSVSESVLATLVMLPASLVRWRVLNADSCFLM